MIVGNLVAKFDLDAKGFAAGMNNVQSMSASVGNRVSSVANRVRGFNSLLAAVGTVAVATGVKLARMSAEIEGIHRKLRFATGSVEAGARAFSKLEKLSKELGISLEVAANNFGSMAASARGTALEGEGVERVFKAISVASVGLGLDNQRTALSFLAVQQMISKTVITQEELRRQLGENLPGAIQIMARALEVSTEELNKMVATGALLAENVLPLFAEQIEKEFGPAIADLGETMAVALGKLGTAWFKLKSVLSEGIVNKTLNLFITLLGSATSALGSFISFVNKAVDSVFSFHFSLGGSESKSFYQTFYDNLDFGKKKLHEFNEAQKNTAEIAEATAEKRAALEKKTADSVAFFKNKFATLSEALDTKASLAGATAYEAARIKILAAQEQQIKEVEAFRDTQLKQLKAYEDAKLGVEAEASSLLLKIRETTNAQLSALDQQFSDLAKETFQERFGAVMGLARRVMQDFSTFLVNWSMGAKVSFKDMIDSMLHKILEFTTQLLVIEPILRSFQGYLGGIHAGGGGAGGFFGKIFGFLGGGKMFAKGGMINEPVMGVGVKSKSGYMIGENGPEAVIPKDLLGSVSGGRSSNINVTINAVDSKSVTDLMRQNPQAVTAPIIESLTSGDRALSSSIRLAVN